MDSLCLPKGFLLSSTPVHSYEDSGYFGSGKRRSKLNSNVLNSCSPIKELTFKNAPGSSSLRQEFSGVSPPHKLNENFPKDSIENDTPPSFEINESLEFEFKTPFSSHQIELHKECLPVSETKRKPLLIHYSSVNKNSYYNSFSKDKEIEYKLFDESSGFISVDDFQCSQNLNESSQRRHEKFSRNGSGFQQHRMVDFMHELKIRNCLSIISDVLSYLSAKELCIASRVCKEWQEVIQSDSKANLRRKHFIEERFAFLNGPSKENRMGMKYGPAKEHKKLFSDLTNIKPALSLSVTSKVSTTKFDSFIKEAKSGQKLLKCPKCSFASKCIDGNNCLCSHCFYRFCSNCLDPILKNHSCFKPPLPTIIVGSRKSKKNLRRL